MSDHKVEDIDQRRDSGYSSEAILQRRKEALRIITRVNGTTEEKFKDMFKALFDLEDIELGTIFSALDAYALHVETMDLNNELSLLLKSLSAAWINVTTQDRRDIAQRLLNDTWHIDMRDLFINRFLKLVLQGTFKTHRRACLVYLGAFLSGADPVPVPGLCPWMMEPEFRDIYRRDGLVNFSAHIASSIDHRIVSRAQSCIIDHFAEFGPFWWTFLDFTLDGNSVRRCSCLYIGTTKTSGEANCRKLLQNLNKDVEHAKTLGIVTDVDPPTFGTLSSAQMREQAYSLSLQKRTYARLQLAGYTHHLDYTRVVPGSSISGECESNAGTLCLRLSTSSGKRFGLTCGHVLSDKMESKVVYAPAIWDQAGIQFWTAQGFRFAPDIVKPQESTKIGIRRVGVVKNKDYRHHDWCLFGLEEHDSLCRPVSNTIEILPEDLAQFPRTWPTISGSSRIAGIKLKGQVPEGETLMKIGAVTNKTIGQVNSQSAKVWFDEENEFVTQVLVGSSGSVDHGDSGSVVIRPCEDGEGFIAIGMVFGSNHTQRNITLFSNFSEFWTDMEASVGEKLSL